LTCKPAQPGPVRVAVATLAKHGEEGTAAVGDVLFRVGDRSYPGQTVYLTSSQARRAPPA
jgi:hypothetical protein